MKVVESVIDSLRSEAEKEMMDEFKEKAKTKIKNKMRDLEVAKRLVKNIQMELDDIYVELAGSECSFKK